MRKFIVCVFMLSFWALYSDAEASQEEVRALCVQKNVDRCLKQCEKTKRISCSSACNEVARNQCRQAGE